MMDNDVEELLGAYALDALDDSERLRVESRLSMDPRWLAEVRAHRETIGFLTEAMLAGKDETPPARIWEGIVARLEVEPPPLRLVVDPPRRSPLIRAVGAFAAAAAIAVVVLGVMVTRQGDRLDEMTLALEGNRLEQAAADAMTSPGSEVVILASPAGSPIEARIAIGPDGVGYLVADSLPALPSDRSYQLGAIVEGNVLSAGLLGSDPGISPFVVTGELQGLAITEEVAGGVVSSENDPVTIWLRDA